MFPRSQIQRRDDVVAAIHGAFVRREGDDWRRTHLGASIVGHECHRFLWLSFRWAMRPSLDGRMLRLFERGHREEAWIIESLRDAGYEVQDRDPETGHQFRLAGHGMFGGSLDGKIKVDGRWLVLELKSSNKKQFDWLVSKGVKAAQPKHYAQMQLYCYHAGLPGALYISSCKDDDRIYAQQVGADPAEGKRLTELAHATIDAQEPPVRMLRGEAPCLLKATDGTEYPCQYYSLCHGEEMPEKSCRTCLSWSPSCHGTKACKDGIDPTRGCDDYVAHVGMVNADPIGVHEGVVAIQFPSGKVVETGGGR